MDFSSIESELAKNYRPITISNYRGAIEKLLESVYGDREHRIEALSSPEVFHFMTNIQDPTEQRMIFQIAITVLKTFGLSALPFEQYVRDNRVKFITQLPVSSDKEEANFMSWNDIVALRDSYEQRSDLRIPTVYRKYMTLCLYTMVPPLRSQDWYTASIRQDSPGNYIDLDKKLLVCRVYKTSDIYGERTIELTSRLIRIIRTWIEISGTTEWLFPGRCAQNHMLQGSFTNHLNNIFTPKKISSSMLRKIFISDKIAEWRSLPQEEEMRRRSQLAIIMGHSPSTQIFMYSKFKI
ncbi:MAG: hypothetical protein KAS32_27120 [Candidatus Peribacteraceae bacterium]|nr:hypothetical protein [Candidatus Peribacteraceae bacterium]